jgi:hypothetical protein
MAELGNLTKKVAGKVGSAAISATRTVGGVTGAIAAGTYNTIKTGFMRATDINSLRPRNIAANALDSIGLGAIMPAFGKDPRKNEAVRAAERVADQNKSAAISLKPMENLLQTLIDINQKLLNNSNQLVDFAKKQNSILEKANDLVEKQTLQSIENSREANKPKANVPALAAANDNAEGAKKPGGFLGKLFDSAKGLLGFLAPIGNFITGIGSVLAGLARFAVRFLGPVGILAGIFLALEREDWAKLFDNLGKVFGDLAEGKIGDAIVRMIGTIGDVLLKGIGRIGVMLLNFFGFEDTAKKFSKWLDEFNLADTLVEWFHAATDWLSEIAPMLEEGAKWVGKKIGVLIVGIWDTISGTFSTLFKDITDSFEAFKSGDILTSITKIIASIPNAIIQFVGRALATIINFFGGDEIAKSIRDFLDNFNLADTIINFFTSVKDWAVEKFTNTTKTFSDWWNSFSILEPITNFFSSIKDWIVQKFTDASKAISDWWDSFSIIDIVLSPFNLLKEKISTAFDNIKKEIDDVLSFDLAGKISESVGSVVNGVWNFFKSLPSKAVDLVSGLIPDSLKNSFKSMFGGGENTNTPSVTRTPEEKPTLTPRNMGLAIQDNMVNASPSGKEQEFNQQSAKMAVEKSAPPAPVIINNTNNNTSSGQSQTPRVSGAVQTAPQDSHIDRALYGNFYGAGVP